MKKLTFLSLLITIVFMTNTFSQDSPKEKGLEVITKEAIQAQLEFLASDWTEGRGTGEKGIYLAGDYVASMFKFSGISPGGDLSFRQMRRGGRPSAPERSYFQRFTLLEVIPDGSSQIYVKRGKKELLFQENIDFRVSNASVSMKMYAPVVFVGYGIESEEFGLNDFVNADLNGKIAVRLSGFPGMNDTSSAISKKLREDWRAYRELSRNRDEKLKKLGAVAVIDISPSSDVSRGWGESDEKINLSPNESSWRSDWSSLRLDNDDAINDLANITVTKKVANAILEGSGLDLEKYEENAAKGNSYKPVDIRTSTIGLIINVKLKRINVRNVVAMVEGENKDEVIVVGAHMDHMGMSGGRVWNGADDNASGTVGVMTIAEAFAATGVKPKKTVLFCAWTGEEKGLLGSEYFTLNPTVGEIDQYKFYLNYDMISRDSDNDEEGINCGVTYTKAYTKLEEITNKNAEEFDINLNLNFRPSEEPRGGSDHTAFTDQKVPIMYMMAGFPQEYHTPEDEINLINWDKMLEIIKLGFLNMWDIANSDF